MLLDQSRVLCAPCYGTIRPVTNIFLSLTPKRAMAIYAASSYEHPLRSLVLRKFAQDTLAYQQLGKLMVQLIDIQRIKPDIIVPIPLHWTRYARRGFNQAHITATTIGKAFQIPVMPLLYRTRKTFFQSRLSKKDREENVTQAFNINDWYGLKDVSFVAGKKIMLIDDLCTTGATLQQAGKTLLRLQPASIVAAVACRAI